MSKSQDAMPGSQQQVVRHTVAARVAAMESEKLYLQTLHGELGRQWRSIGDRIESINRQVAAEKASVPNDVNQPLRRLH
jgi:hypothetical protein